VLKTLPPDRQAAIADFAASHSLAETAKWLADDGLQTNRSSLSDFLSWHALQEQFRQDEQTTDAILEKLKTEVAGISDEQLDEVGQRTFSLLALRRQDLDGFVNIRSAKITAELERAKLKLREQAGNRQEKKLEQDARKLALLEKKAEAYDRAQAALTSARESKGGLTPETLQKIEQELRLL
jgi:hypothetical protein